MLIPGSTRGVDAPRAARDQAGHEFSTDPSVGTSDEHDRIVNKHAFLQ
jgi:hypothetical protein